MSSSRYVGYSPSLQPQQPDGGSAAVGGLSSSSQAAGGSVSTTAAGQSSTSGPALLATMGGGGGIMATSSAAAVGALQAALDAAQVRCQQYMSERDAALTALGKVREGYLLTDAKLRQVATALAASMHENKELFAAVEEKKAAITSLEGKHAAAMGRVKERMDVAGRINEGIVKHYHLLRFYGTSVGKMPQMTAVEAHEVRKMHPLCALQQCHDWLGRFAGATLSKQEVSIFLAQFLQSRAFAARSPLPPPISLSGLASGTANAPANTSSTPTNNSKNNNNGNGTNNNSNNINNSVSRSGAGAGGASASLSPRAIAGASASTSPRGAAGGGGGLTLPSPHQRRNNNYSSTMSATGEDYFANISSNTLPANLPQWVSAFILGTDVLEGRSIISASEADLAERTRQTNIANAAALKARQQREAQQAAAESLIEGIASNPTPHLKSFDGHPSRYCTTLPDAHAVIDKLNDRLEQLVKVVKAQEERHTREVKGLLRAEEELRGTSTQEALKALREKLRDTQKLLEDRNVELKRYRVNASDYVVMQREVSEANEKAQHHKLLLEQRDQELLRTQRGAVERSMAAKDAMRSLTQRAEVSSKLQFENAQLKRAVEDLSAQLRRIDVKGLQDGKDRAELIAKSEGLKLREAESQLSTVEARARALADTNQRMSAEYNAIFRAHMEAMRRQKEAAAHEATVESKQFIVGDRSPLMAEHYLGKYQEAMRDLNTAQRRLRHLLMVAHHDHSANAKRIANLEKDLSLEKGARWSAEESLHVMSVSRSVLDNGGGGGEDGAGEDGTQYTHTTTDGGLGTGASSPSSQPSVLPPHRKVGKHRKNTRVSTLSRSAKSMVAGALKKKGRRGGGGANGEEAFAGRQRLGGGDDEDDDDDIAADAEELLLDDDYFYSANMSGNTTYGHGHGQHYGPAAAKMLHDAVTNVTVSPYKRTVTIEKEKGGAGGGTSITTVSSSVGIPPPQQQQHSDAPSSASSAQQALTSDGLPPPSSASAFAAAAAPANHQSNSSAFSIASGPPSSAASTLAVGGGGVAPAPALSSSSPSSSLYSQSRTFTSNDLPNVNTAKERSALAGRLRATFGEAGSRTHQSMDQHGKTESTHQKSRLDVNAERDRGVSQSTQRRAGRQLDTILTEELIAKEVMDGGMGGGGGGAGLSPIPHSRGGGGGGGSMSAAAAAADDAGGVGGQEVSSRSIPRRAMQSFGGAVGGGVRRPMSSSGAATRGGRSAAPSSSNHQQQQLNNSANNAVNLSAVVNSTSSSLRIGATPVKRPSSALR